MELDELKSSWKKTEGLHKPKNNDIMEIIQHKSYGPIAALKKSFRKQAILIILLAAVVVNNLSRKHEIFTDVMFWCYIIFCLGLCLFFYLNYRLVSKMEHMDGMVKSTLEQQVATLEKRLKWHINGIRIILVFFIVLSEVLPSFADEPMLDKWHF